MRVVASIFSVLFGTSAVAGCPAEAPSESAMKSIFDQSIATLRSSDDNDRFAHLAVSLECLASHGDAVSAKALAELYLGKELGDPDIASAMFYLDIAVENGDADLVHEVGQAFLHGQLSIYKFEPSLRKAITTFEKASRQGSAAASFSLCSIYRSDWYGMVDYSTAITYCRIAAEQGDRLAETTTADLLFEHGTYPQDAKEAVELYFSSAMFGSNFGPMGLARAYETGVGVLQDYLLAHAWYNVASSRLGPDNRKEAAEGMLRMEGYLEKTQIIEAQDTARRILAEMSKFAP